MVGNQWKSKKCWTTTTGKLHSNTNNRSIFWKGFQFSNLSISFHTYLTGYVSLDLDFFKVMHENACSIYFSLSVYTESTAGEISSDLYRDQFFRRFLNLSSLLFIYMFLIHFKIVFDEKIHCQAQQTNFLILSIILHGSCPDMIIEVFSELYE